MPPGILTTTTSSGETTVTILIIGGIKIKAMTNGAMVPIRIKATQATEVTIKRSNRAAMAAGMAMTRNSLLVEMVLIKD